MSTNVQQPSQPKKSRGRPSKNSLTSSNNNNNGTVNSNNNNNVNNVKEQNRKKADDSETTTTTNTIKRKSLMDSIIESESDQTVSSELQNLAIEQVGQDVFQKVMELSRGSLSIFCAYMNIFRIFKEKKPDGIIPQNWYQDKYWMYSSDERIDMLNKAFEIQDDDADLKTTVEGEFKCNACKSKRIRLRLRQIRSSDEAMSQFFKCADCKKEWVIH
jgi:DNA-directed RNA polymerase subunit M/transcription elongation factor TFIIS